MKWGVRVLVAGLTFVTCSLLLNKTALADQVDPNNQENNQTSQVIEQNSEDQNQQDQQNSDDQNNHQVNPNPVLNGFHKKGKVTYYYQNNKITKGFKKINNHWYYFDRNGAMKTGLQHLNRRYTYFDCLGRQHRRSFKTKRAYYWVNKRGIIVGIKNYAHVVCQRPQMPTGCEITAVTMLLNFAGKHVSKYRAARVMHYSKNPNRGFIGSPYKKYPGGYWVAPNGIKSVLQHYLHRAQVMTYASLTAVKNKLLQSHLVVFWMGNFDGFSNHAITLTGFKGKTFYYNDPWTGTKRAISQNRLLYHWRRDGYRALSY